MRKQPQNAGVTVAAIMKEGIKTILQRNMAKHAFHWTPLTGSTVPSTPPGSTTHLAIHERQFNHVQNLPSQHQKLEENSQSL